MRRVRSTTASPRGEQEEQEGTEGTEDMEDMGLWEEDTAREEFTQFS